MVMVTRLMVITSKCMKIANHCYTPEINRILYVNYTSIKKILSGYFKRCPGKSKVGTWGRNPNLGSLSKCPDWG